MAETNYEPASLVDVLSRDRVHVERLPQLGLIGVIDELCDAIVKGGQMGLLITGQTAAALCLANRQRGVRAALGNDVQTVVAAVTSVAANLLVIDPVAKSLFELKQIMYAWFHAGRQQVPAPCANDLNKQSKRQPTPCESPKS